MDGALISYQSFLLKGSTLCGSEMCVRGAQCWAIKAAAATLLVTPAQSMQDVRLLLAALLSLGQPLVLTHRHGDGLTGAAGRELLRTIVNTMTRAAG